MMLDKVLSSLLENLDSTAKQIVIGWDAVQQWNTGVLDKLVAAGLLEAVSSAQSLECKGCEYHCFMDVITDTNNTKQTRAFIVCDVPEMQDQMGRIEVPVERLKQWQCSIKQLAAVIAGLLGLEAKPTYQKESSNYKLGMLKGDKGRRWVFLTVQPLALVINQYTVPVNDLLYFDENELVIDQLRINELLNSVQSDTGKAYVPDASKREARKLETQAINHIFWRQNEGFLLLYTWFKDALLQKNGYVKYWIEETDEKEREEYDGVTPAGLAQIMAEGEYEIVEHEESVTKSMDGEPLHRIVIENQETGKRIVVENIPPEKMLVSDDAKSEGE